MFWCLPPNGKCEWANLREFVRHFNETHGSTYSLSRCLDVSDSSRSQPEVLLEAEGEVAMVIERKVIVWPPDYLKYHRWEDWFMRLAAEGLSSHFADGLFVLEVPTTAIRGSKGQIRQNADRIVGQVLANKDLALRRHGIGGRSPIPWRFRPVLDFERDATMPKKGVGVILIGDSLDGQITPEKLQVALNGVSTELARQLVASSRKFSSYEGCLRLVVLECYSDLLLLNDEDVGRLVVNANLPTNVDQVWHAKPEWVSESDWQVVYERLR